MYTPPTPKSSGQVPNESHLCPTMWLQLLEAVASHQVVPGSPLWWLGIYSFCQILNYSLGFGHTCFCYSSEKTLTSMECYTPKTFQNSRHLKSQNDANFHSVFTALKQCCVLWGKGKCLPLSVPFCEKVVKSSTPSWLKWECPSSCPKLTILCLKPALPIELFFFSIIITTILSYIHVQILWNLSVPVSISDDSEDSIDFKLSFALYFLLIIDSFILYLFYIDLLYFLKSKLG